MAGRRLSVLLEFPKVDNDEVFLQTILGFISYLQGRECGEVDDLLGTLRRRALSQDCHCFYLENL